MSWSRRTLLAALAVAGCGFTPVYGPGGSGSVLDGKVSLTTPASVDGYTMRQRIQDRLGPPQRTEYSLQVLLSTFEEEVGVTRDLSIPRYNLIGEAGFSLTRLADGAVVASGSVRDFVGYGSQGTPLATQSAQRDAHVRLSTVLADAVVERLLLEFGA